MELDHILTSGEKEKNITNETSSMQNILRQVQLRSPNTAGVYTLTLENELHIIVVTKNLKILQHSVSIPRSTLNAEIATFRRQLQDPCSDPRMIAHQLYDTIISPIVADLEDAKIKTIVWELDGVLRYIPMSALYDGHRYLAETYESVLFTTTHTDALVSAGDVGRVALGLGLTRSREGLPSLPAVSDELEGIIHDPEDEKSKGPLTGKILIDDKFTSTMMAASLHNQYPIVHIASHFVLEPGSDQSYLLLGAEDDASRPGSGRLTFAELRDNPEYTFDNVQLLTLSACQTGTSAGPGGENGMEIDGLGDLAEEKGAKAVLATLWPVNDFSTGKFMVDFYRLWTTSPNTSKVGALRQAQVNLLRNEQPNVGRLKCAKSTLKASFTHPYYWAPFILIGNWQ
jgi:CHAT domain-containing protein